jgi:hypothetical protein
LEIKAMAEQREKKRKDPAQRYITLDGYPLHKPLWQTFHQAAAFSIPVATLGVALGLEYLTKGGASAFNMAVHSIPNLAAMSGWQFFLRRSDLRGIFGARTQNLCIDTSPDLFTPPTSLNDLARSAELAKFSTIWASMYAAALLSGLPIAQVFHSPRSPLEILGVGAGILLPAAASYASAAMRFNKVANGNYVITDPPPKPAKQAASAGLFTRMGLQTA